MSNTVDNRAINLGFDNKQFESGVKQSTDSLDKLKKGLDLSEQAKGLHNLASAGRAFNIGPIAEGVQNISSKFSVLGVIGFTVLQNLTNAVVELGNKMWKSISQPAKQGFSEYETQMNAIQTIMANTASKGTTLQQVNDILEEMNTYADKTIYSFPEMAKNMGTFTAAGIELNVAAGAIKGIANLAAVSGSNSQQAATAMYQLSQALSSGTVKLMDWNSVVNAGMGGQVFQDALKETARVHGIAIDDIITKQGSFRETLSEGWLTSEILTETLSKFTGDLNAEQLKSMGYTEEQITQIIKLGETAKDAATKVKTLSQLKETIKEALGSGWAKTWQIVVGNFGEAKALFSGISDAVGGFINTIFNAQNTLLQGWKDLGGRTMLLRSFANVFAFLGSVLAPIGDAFKELFPVIGLNAQLLKTITYNLMLFTMHLKLGGKATEQLKRIFKGVFAIFDIVRLVIVALYKEFKNLASGIKINGSGLLELIAKWGDYALALRDSIKANDTIQKTIQKVKDYIIQAKIAIISFADQTKAKFQGILTLFQKLKEKFDNFKKSFTFKFPVFKMPEIDTSGIVTFLDNYKARFGPIVDFLKGLIGTIKTLSEGIKNSLPDLSGVKTKISEFFSGIWTSINEGLSKVKFDNVKDMANIGIFGTLVLAISNFLKKGSGVFGGITDMFKGVADVIKGGGGLFAGLTGMLDGARKSLEAYQKNLQSKTLLNIAIAIAILAASLLVLSLIDSNKLTIALGAVTGLFADLVASMAILNKTSPGGNLGGAASLSLTLIAMGVSLLLLTAALKQLSDIDQAELQNGLISLGLISAGLVAFMRLLGSNAKSFARSAISLIILSVGLKIIADVVEKLGTINAGTLQNGLITLGIVLAELMAFTQLSGNMKGGSGIGLLAVTGAVLLMYTAIEKFGNMDTGILKQGLAAVGVILGELGIFMRLAGDGKKVISTAIGMAILAGVMLIFVEVISRMGLLSWDQLSRGLAGMAGALLAIVIAVNLMPKNMIVTAIALAIIAGAIFVLTTSLTLMSDMSWDEIGRGLTVLGGALLIISVAMIAMQGSIGGAIALIIVAGALAILTPILLVLGTMQIATIAIALGVLAGVFIVLGIAGAILTPVVPTLLGLAVAIALLGVAIALIGGGILMFSMGLAGLAVSGVAGAAALVAIVGVLLGIVPLVIAAIIGGIILFAKLIITAAPIIGQAFIAIIKMLCDVIIESVPNIVAALTVLLNALWQLIREQVPQAVDAILFVIGELLISLAASIPQFTQSAFDILIGFLQGIRDNIAEVVTVVGEIITEFLAAVVLALPDIIQSGFDVLISFIDGITKAIEENGPTLATSIGKLAGAIVKGLTDGLLGGVQNIVDAIGEIGGAIILALKTLLGITSPSKVMEDIGEYSDLGLAKGLIKYAYRVEDAAEMVGKKAVSGMSNAIRHINDTLNNNLDINPVIRPVMDLTAVEVGGRNINNLLGKKSIQLSGSLNNISLVATRMINQNGSQELINKPVSQGSTVTFYQTNTSPKALSAFEIYRQTRNQLLSLKGLVISE